MTKQLATFALLVMTSLGAMQAFAGDDSQPIKDAFITGKLEGTYLLNGHLNVFTIHPETNRGVVHLTGTVESEIDRDLAGELAKGIDGVVSVKNDLVVKTGSSRAKASSKDADRTFGQFVDDATTTAMVKLKLLADPNIKGLKIAVETRGDIVTLTGKVGSSEQKQLAEQLTRNTGDVKNVRNELVIDKSVG
ncbi:MAG TPA: BON domain-containing protein [Gammaproteobacteria bacterium]|nr:BON domain-containing protein [Gammaproteobacteria bacterium]